VLSASEIDCMLCASKLRESLAGSVAAWAGSCLGAMTAARQICLALREILRVAWRLGVTAANVHPHFHRVAWVSSEGDALARGLRRSSEETYPVKRGFSPTRIWPWWRRVHPASILGPIVPGS
jgi:hypothetical protein